MFNETQSQSNKCSELKVRRHQQVIMIYKFKLGGSKLKKKDTHSKISFSEQAKGVSLSIDFSD